MMSSINSLLTNDRANRVFCLALVILMCLRHAVGVAIPLSFVSLLSLAVFLTSHPRRTFLNKSLACFVAIYGLSLLLHPAPEPWLRTQRFLAFLIGMLCFSPLLTSDSLAKTRLRISAITYYVLSAMVFLSFLVWLASFIRFGEDGIWKSGIHNYGFCGIFKVGMVLSPVSAIIAITSAFLLLEGKCKIKPFLNGLILFTGIMMCVAGGSRIASVGLFLSLASLLIIKRHVLAQMLHSRLAIAMALSGTILLIASSPYALSVIRHKNMIGESHGSLFYSRERLWHDRIEEFASSPLTGIGYANEFPSERNKGSLTEIEPGSSWLALMSYGGLVGLGCFLWFSSSLARMLYRIRDDGRFPICLAILLFLVINAFTEGWLMFAGSIIFPVFWLATSAVWAATCNRKKHNIKSSYEND